MLETKFWSIKQHIQYFIDKNKLENICSIGASVGSRCGELCILDKMTSTEFMKKYPIIETEFMKGFLTKSHYSENFITVSFKRKNYVNKSIY